MLKEGVSSVGSVNRIIRFLSNMTSGTDFRSATMQVTTQTKLFRRQATTFKVTVNGFLKKKKKKGMTWGLINCFGAREMKLQDEVF